jgi:hypothetical protein
MNRRDAPPEFLIRCSKLPAERIVYYAEADESLLGEIHHGVLFLMDFWSIAAVHRLKELTDRVARLDPLGHLEFVVVNVDGLLQRCFKQLGNSDTAWVHAGELMAHSEGFVDRKVETQRLLDLVRLADVDGPG